MKVYVYKYVWENGRKFEGGAGVRVFANKENASATLKRDIDEFIKSFMSYYDKEDITIEYNGEDCVTIYANHYEDCITLTVEETELE